MADVALRDECMTLLVAGQVGTHGPVSVHPWTVMSCMEEAWPWQTLSHAHPDVTQPDVVTQETSAILLAWAAAFLAHHPAAQEAAAAEVHTVLRGRSPCEDDIK
jgi:cytochrome P450